MNSFGVGIDGDGEACAVRGVAVGGGGFEWLPEIRATATLMPPITIATIASAASNLRMFCIRPSGYFWTSTSHDRLAVSRVARSASAAGAYARGRWRKR